LQVKAVDGGVVVACLLAVNITKCYFKLDVRRLREKKFQKKKALIPFSLLLPCYGHVGLDSCS